MNKSCCGGFYFEILYALTWAEMNNISCVQSVKCKHYGQWEGVYLNIIERFLRNREFQKITEDALTLAEVNTIKTVYGLKKDIMVYQFVWCNFFLKLSLKSYDSNLRKLVFRKIAIDGVKVKSNFSIVLSDLSFYGYI